MVAELEGCLADYLRVAGDELTCEENGEIDGRRLRASLERLEKTKSFAALARATGQAFNRSEFELGIHGIWLLHAQTFLRLSGVYPRLAAGDIVTVPEVYQQYREAFQSTSFKITYLAPLEFVEFSQDSIDFGQFQIRRYSSKELDDLLQNITRQLFYPRAVVNSSVLADYWFLVAQETVFRSPLDDWNSIMSARVGISYSGHPSAVQVGMRQLALFNWGSQFKQVPSEPRPTKRDEWDGPLLPRIPFVIRLSDSRLGPPTGPPDVSELSSEPVFDPDSGEEVGERRTGGIFMNELETEQFQRSLQRTTELMMAIEPYRVEWRFMDTALDFLLKAYTTEGLEQLLWHVTAIEAVLGQKTEAGLTKLLLNRTSSILGASAEERRGFKKRFDELYSFRSALVHGNADLADQKIYLGHLSEARDFARCIVAWMLNYLAQITKGLPGVTGGAPNRDHLVNLIDLDSEGRRQTAKILGGVPSEFPNVSDWFC